MKQQLLVLLVPVLILLASCQPQSKEEAFSEICKRFQSGALTEKEAIDKLGVNKDELFWGCLKPLQF